MITKPHSGQHDPAIQAQNRPLVNPLPPEGDDVGTEAWAKPIQDRVAAAKNGLALLVNNDRKPLGDQQIDLLQGQAGILEQIATGGELDQTLRQLALVVERCLSQVRCTIELTDPDRGQRLIAPFSEPAQTDQGSAGQEKTTPLFVALSPAGIMCVPAAGALSATRYMASGTVTLATGAGGGVGSGWFSGASSLPGSASAFARAISAAAR